MPIDPTPTPDAVDFDTPLAEGEWFFGGYDISSEADTARAWASVGFTVTRVRLVPSSPVRDGAPSETFTEAEWESLLWSLQSRAPYLAARFGAPVYLVGSALNWRERAPRDIDIRIVLPDTDWEARFGGNSSHFNADCPPAYVAEVGKLTRDLVRDFQRNIDIQVQPENWLTRHNAHDKPRLLLADCPASRAPVDGGAP